MLYTSNITHKVADYTLVNSIYFNRLKIIKVRWALHECSITKCMQWQNLIFCSLNLSIDKSDSSLRKLFSDRLWKLWYRCTYLSFKVKINNSTSFFACVADFQIMPWNKIIIICNTEKHALFTPLTGKLLPVTKWEE